MKQTIFKLVPQLTEKPVTYMIKLSKLEYFLDSHWIRSSYPDFLTIL